MADTLTKAERSERMRRVRAKDSKAKMAVHSLAHRMGYRFRLHRKNLPGTPDIVMPLTRANRRSPWDTLHPGRDWAWSDPDMENARSEERILSDIRSHLGSTTIYRDVDQLLKGFLEELSQL